jgi:alkanesulfonate monooxygenase SsuD/methylene tetrahydromethanopterin reductase-like flavin-dependent oxidoreductase (luciferase family)
MTSESRMRLGMSLPIGTGALGDGKPVPWLVLREMAKRAEAVGFGALMAPDHLLFRRSPPTNVPAVDMPEGKTRGIWEFDLAGMRFPARLGSVEEVTAHVRAFAATGIEHLTVAIVDPPGLRGIERFAAVIEALRR